MSQPAFSNAGVMYTGTDISFRKCRFIEHQVIISFKDKKIKFIWINQIRIYYFYKGIKSTYKFFYINFRKDYKQNSKITLKTPKKKCYKV